MAKVAVGLWTRDTHDYSIPIQSTLRDLEKVVKQTREWAVSKGITAQAGKLRSIFVAPEFLFTRKRKKDDHSGTTAISKPERDIALAKVLEIAKASPSMLLIPGTIVFGESLLSAWEDWLEKKDKKPLKKDGKTRLDPIAAAVANLRQAANPMAVNDLGKNFGKSGAALNRITRKAYPTKEAPEDEQNETGYKKFYETQIEELTKAQQLMVSGNPDAVEQNFLIKNRTYVFFDKEKIFSYGKKSNMGDYADDEHKGIFIPGRKEGITTIDGLKVGIEICFDHNAGILSDHMGGAVGRKAFGLDLHVICSAEVPNEQSRCMAKPGGYLVHASTGAGGHEHTAVYKQGTGVNWEPVQSQEPVRGTFGGHLRLYEIDLPN